MDQALDVGMVTDAYHYILTNLDVYTMDMSMYRTQVGGVCVCVGGWVSFNVCTRDAMLRHSDLWTRSRM